MESNLATLLTSKYRATNFSYPYAFYVSILRQITRSGMAFGMIDEGRPSRDSE